jgi:plasmid maintenance system killer protein
MIRSFREDQTKRLFKRLPVKRLARQLQRSALRKPLLLAAASTLGDLRLAPENHLEKLIADRMRIVCEAVMPCPRGRAQNRPVLQTGATSPRFGVYCQSSNRGR